MVPICLYCVPLMFRIRIRKIILVEVIKYGSCLSKYYQKGLCCYPEAVAVLVLEWRHLFLFVLLDLGKLLILLPLESSIHLYIMSVEEDVMRIQKKLTKMASGDGVG